MKTARETREILDKLETQHPGADTELHYHDAVRAADGDDPLGAVDRRAGQHGDAGALQALSRTRARWPRRPRATLEPQIHSTGFFRAKARSLLGMAQALVAHHGGEVPTTMEALVELPGVGRKTANVVLGHALGVPGLPVDRHVLRVSNRIGIAEGDDPIVVEQQLCDAMPPERWTRTSDTLILHGRRICRPKPLCDQCFVRDDCDYYRLVVSRERSAKPKPKPKRNSKAQKRKLKTVGKKPVRKARR